jgi:hypothetical protein
MKSEKSFLCPYIVAISTEVTAGMKGNPIQTPRRVGGGLSRFYCITNSLFICDHGSIYTLQAVAFV